APIQAGRLFVFEEPSAIPDNNDCSGAIPFPETEKLEFDTSSASPSYLETGCVNASSPDVWFEFTAPRSGEYDFAICGTLWRPVIEIFDSSLIPDKSACPITTTNSTPPTRCSSLIQGL